MKYLLIALLAALASCRITVYMPNSIQTDKDEHVFKPGTTIGPYTHIKEPWEQNIPKLKQ